MNRLPRLASLFLLATVILSCQSPGRQFVTLEGEAMDQQTAAQMVQPYLSITSASESKGTLIAFPGEGPELDSLGSFWVNEQGYDLATVSGTATTPEEALRAVRLVQSGALSLNVERLTILGIGDGAALAAKATQELTEAERPDELILINPAGMGETIPGTVYAAVNPPISGSTTLLCIADTTKLSPEALTTASEFTKTWIGYDGIAFFREIGSVEHLTAGDSELTKTLTAFRNGEMVFPRPEENPAAVPVEGYYPDRHAEKVALARQHRYDLLFIGNSITHNFEKPQYQPVWEQYFGSRDALNLGYSGYRTENILWNLQHGELSNQSPKVIILEIGTNNIDEVHYPTRHTAGQLAGGMEAIVQILRDSCPESKIIVLGCFPGCYGGPNPTSHRTILERASDIVSQLADNEHIFYLNVNHIFLTLEGAINHDLMPDWLHPNPKGARRWAEAMEELVGELMGNESTLEVPASKE